MPHRLHKLLYGLSVLLLLRDDSLDCGTFTLLTFIHELLDLLRGRGYFKHAQRVHFGGLNETKHEESRRTTGQNLCGRRCRDLMIAWYDQWLVW